MKSLLRNIIKQTPLRSISRNLQYDHETERIMQKVLQPEANCIDVGCHKGEVLDEMLHFAPRGKHIGFEPIPAFYDHLLEKYENNTRVTIHKLALSDKQGTTDFAWVTTNPAYSGIRERTYGSINETVEHITVKMDLLDNLLADDHEVNFIKVDVEGAELQVFKGAEKTLKKWRPYIVFEHGLGAADHYGTKPEDVYRFLSECGLKINLLSGYLNGAEALSEQQFTGHFQKNTHYYFIAYPAA